MLYTPAPGVALSDEYPRQHRPTDSGGNWRRSVEGRPYPLFASRQYGRVVDGALAVSIHDVVEHLSERVRYYTDAIAYNTDGSAAGQVYNTSRYPKNLQWVKAILRVPAGVSDAIYRAGAYRVDSDNHILEVLGESGASGIITGTGNTGLISRYGYECVRYPTGGSERIEILIRRVGAGNTADTGSSVVKKTLTLQVILTQMP